jgi:hypothetical protein
MFLLGSKGERRGCMLLSMAPTMSTLRSMSRGWWGHGYASKLLMFEAPTLYQQLIAWWKHRDVGARR